MNRQTNWFFLALLGCGACDVMLGVDGDYTTATGTGGGAGQTVLGSDSEQSGATTSSSSSASSSSGSSGQPTAQPVGQIAQVITGGLHTCARTIKGEVKCWGYAGDGQLGLGDLGNTSWIGSIQAEMGANLPYVKFGKGRTAVDIATNPSTPYVCAVLDDGTISCWGLQIAGWNNINMLLPTSVGLPGHAALKVAVGRDHACALLANGGIMCWGSNGSGQFGNGQTAMTTDYIPPKLDNEVNLGMGRTAKAIAAGDRYTCALLDDDTAKCWGWSAWGALGLAGKNQILNPATSPAIDFGGKKVRTISTTAYHVCALLVDDSAYCWGDNGSGQLGMGDTTMKQVPASVLPGQSVRHISAGYTHTCAVLANRSVKCWGYNGYGNLGLGHWMNMLAPTDVADLGTGLSCDLVAASYYHSCALLQNGTLKCWGDNFHGTLGIGQSESAVGDEPNEMGDNLPNVLFF